MAITPITVGFMMVYGRDESIPNGGYKSTYDLWWAPPCTFGLEHVL